MRRRLQILLAAALLTLGANSHRPAPVQPPTPSGINESKPDDVTGRVMFADGTPAADATIWATWDRGVFRADRRTVRVKTNRRGEYLMGNRATHTGAKVFIFATHPDAPPAFEVVTGGSGTTAPDIRLPADQVALTVTVLRADGTPAPGVSVTMRPEQWPLLPVSASDCLFVDGTTEDLFDALIPRVITGKDGVAHFRHLRRDFYTLAAVLHPPKPPGAAQTDNRVPRHYHLVFLNSIKPFPHAMAKGVRVESRELRHTLRLAPPSPGETVGVPRK